MRDIPEDIIEEARRRWPTSRDDGAAIHMTIARAILAERQRCADVARRYLEDIAGCDMSDDEPDKIAAAILDPKWGPPPL